jgi:hypothetical protein
MSTRPKLLRHMILPVCDFVLGLAISLLLFQIIMGSTLLAITVGILTAIGYTALLSGLRYKRSSYVNRITLFGAVCLLLVIGYAGRLALALHDPVRHTGTIARTVWLPVPREDSTDPFNQFGKVGASWNFGYGASLVFRPVVNDSKWGFMAYESDGAVGLSPGKCPNIAQIETVDPQECNKIGEVHGAPVYAMNRSLPLGDYEVYTRFGGTFIFMNLPMGNSKDALSYLGTFRKVPGDQVVPQLKNNAAAAKTRAAYEAHQKSTVTRRLPFTPAVPSEAALSRNWSQSGDTRIGGTLERPDLVETSYTDGHGNTITVMVVSAKTFHFQPGACSPVPHESKPLDCQSYGSQGDYYANGPAVQYLFRQVGDAMTITQILLDSSDFTTPGKETDVLRVGQAVVDSLHSVDRSSLHKVDFVEGYGQ